jgi:hypothetical protein
MTVTIKHSKTNAISDWTQAQLDEQIELGNFAPGTVLADIVLPSDWNNDHTLTGLGTMAEQDANNVAITGGTINGTTIGATTATTGKFTDLTDTGLTSGRVTYAGTGGNLVDSANLTFDGTNLTAAGIQNTPIGATTASTGRFTSVTTPSVTATTLDLALNSVGTGTINLSSGNGIAFRALDNGATGNSWAAYGSTVSPVLEASGSSTNVNGIVRTKGTGILAFRTNTIDEQLRVSHTASAVNYVQVTGAATGGFVAISAQGSDSNPGIYYTTKGFGSHRFTTNTGGGSEQFRIITNSASTVNFLQVNGSATTLAPQFSAQGTDTNISMAFQPKGTGAINLAAGSSGVNISNGGTVTAITRSAAGSAYTTPPTVAISAPTTAGGVQATATVTIGLVSVTSIANGGTGYTVGNVLTVVGGTFTVACQVTVTTVSGGVITGVSVATGGSYTVAPTNPVSVTGGSGSGATFNLSFCIGATFTITNAGSGYIEQPTITFSGGGGSGAAAYATVGSFSTIKSLGVGQLITSGANVTNTGFAFFTPNTAIPSFLIRESGGGDAFLVAGPGIGGASLFALGGANSALFLGSNGTSRVSITTNGTSATEQLRVNHTTSAVNYVQVTGGVTGSGPTISGQGSDANAFLAITSKGTSAIRLQTGGTSQVLINNTTSAINQLGLAGSTAGQACSIITQGTDTNIDLALTPKGTGRLRFGTHTATADTAVSGYIEILDSGGTVRRLAVVS